MKNKLVKAAVEEWWRSAMKNNLTKLYREVGIIL
jgi:hypothetical protein